MAFSFIHVNEVTIKCQASLQFLPCASIDPTKTCRPRVDKIMLGQVNK